MRLDEYFARTDSSGNVSTFLSDALGSTVGLVGSAQTIATNYTYQPFGTTTVGGSANGNSYEFTGRENDGTGLYFYRARYYGPTFQRFVAQDPIAFAGGDPNFYTYVRNTTPNSTDPYGLLSFNVGSVPVTADLSVTFLFINVSWDMSGFGLSDFNFNYDVGLSMGASLDINVNPPSSCQKDQKYIQPHVGYRNLGIGTNYSYGPSGNAVQGLNVSIGYAIGIPVGVGVPNGITNDKGP